ncbi:hypothetical protein EI94DRAFT_1709651 [Lactarius quietus]|nr:hypothetical protein EI94DRAFT_1709651 [Lactarius quietus]
MTLELRIRSLDACMTEVLTLLVQYQYIDLVIPRGSSALVRSVEYRASCVSPLWGTQTLAQTRLMTNLYMRKSIYISSHRSMRRPPLRDLIQHVQLRERVVNDIMVSRFLSATSTPSTVTGSPTSRKIKVIR